MPILYSYRRCPYAMRARMALKLADIEIEIREISLRDKPAHMLQLSSKGTVPVLALADGTVIDESLAIMQWALEQVAFKREGKCDALLPQGLSLQNIPAKAGYSCVKANIHAACKALILMNDTEFKKNLDGYKYPERSLHYNSQHNHVPAQLEYRAKGEAFLQQLETLLQQNTYLLAGTPSFADYAIFPFIRQFAAVDSTWFEHSDYPKLRAWLNEWIHSDLFKSIMTKNPTFID